MLGNSSSSNHVAAAALLGLTAYYEIYRWAPLGAWNGQFTFPVVNDQFYPDIVIGFLLLWFAMSFATGRRVGMSIGAALLTLWVVVHCLDWWIPYGRSVPANLGRYSFYSSHTQILPVIGNHYPPDGGHTVLDFLLFPTWLVCVVVMARGLRARGLRSQRE